MPYSAPMLATFARAAAERHPGYAVRGELWSSINGRPLQRFVDAAADLSAVEVSALSRPPWVRTLLRRFGSPVWRARLRMLRTRIRAAGHAAVIFADAPGGVRMHAVWAVGAPADGRTEMASEGAPNNPIQTYM